MYSCVQCRNTLKVESSIKTFRASFLSISLVLRQSIMPLRVVLTCSPVYRKNIWSTWLEKAASMCKGGASSAAGAIVRGTGCMGGDRRACERRLSQNGYGSTHRYVH